MTLEQMASELKAMAGTFRGSTTKSATRRRKLFFMSSELETHAKTIKEIVCTNSSTK